MYRSSSSWTDWPVSHQDTLRELINRVTWLLQRNSVRHSTTNITKPHRVQNSAVRIATGSNKSGHIHTSPCGLSLRRKFYRTSVCPFRLHTTIIQLLKLTSRGQCQTQISKAFFFLLRIIYFENRFVLTPRRRLVSKHCFIFPAPMGQLHHALIRWYSFVILAR